MQINEYKGLLLKIAIAWLGICLLIGFLISSRVATGTTGISVLPQVPKTGEPVVATFNISNPSEEPKTTSYELYINGTLSQQGSTTVAPLSANRHQYAYKNALEKGEQVNFLLKTTCDGANINKTVSLPTYPPQLMSSFVSFATFSTSVMSSMISMEYFDSAFGIKSELNAGFLVCIVLISLLVFLEVTQVIATGRNLTLIRNYRASFRNVSTILFIIFAGMVFTKIVLAIVLHEF